MARRVPGFLMAAALLLPAVAAAQSNQLADYVVFAAGDAKLQSSAVGRNGDVGSNGGKAQLGSFATMVGNIAAGTVKLGRGAGVFGDAYYDVLDARSGFVFGQVHLPLTLPILAFPAPPTLGPLTVPPHEVPKFGTFFPTAGLGYQSITAGSDATIALQGGTYDIGELVLRGHRNNILCVYGGTCVVRVGTKLLLGADRVNSTGGLPDLTGSLSFEFAGTTTVKVGNSGATVRADVTAPAALVKLSSSRNKPTTFSGHLVGARVVVAGHASIGVTVPAGPPVCGDGILDSGTEQCDPPADLACPGQCSATCQCPPPPGTPVLHSVGPSVLNNATSFGLQAFGENFQAGAKLEILDKTTTATLATLNATVISSTELTALLPAGLAVPSGISRELTAKVVNPGNFRSGTPDIGHCTNDAPSSPIACTKDADCPSGTGACVLGDQRLTMFNDAVFLNPNSAAVVPAPNGLCDDGARCQSAAACAGIGTGACSPKLYVTPQQRDEVWVFNTGTRQFVDQGGASGIQGIPVGDNPFHVEMLDAGGGVSRAWVVNRFEDSLSIIDTATDTELARVTGASLGVPGRLRMETEIEFNRAKTRAYLSNENVDEVQVLDISGANRDAPVLLDTVDVGVNPRGMVTNAADTRLYVANIQSADISVVDIAPGSPTENQVVKTIRTVATDPIVGGRMAAWQAFVISGRAPRGIAVSDAQNRVFVTSIGPQTGPRAGVSQIGGIIVNPTVTVIDETTEQVVAHVALNGLDRDRFTCTDPELMVVDDARDRLYVTCQGSGTVDILDTTLLAAGQPAELRTLALPLPTDAIVPTLALNPSTGGFGNKTCAGYVNNPGAACTTDADCSGCPSIRDGLPTTCCALNNPVGLHNGPRGIAASADASRLFVVNQFTTSVSTVDVSAGSAAGAFVAGTTSFPGAFGSDTNQRDRRLGQIEFFTDLKHTNVSCATCHIDDHQDGVFFEADVQGPRLRRVLSVRSSRDTPPLLQDQLLPDLGAFTDVVVHIERGGNVCTPCTELNGVFTCFPAPEGTCTLTSNSENQQNTAYAKAITFFPNPNLNPDGSFSTAVPLPGGGTGDAVRGEQVFDQLACASCHPEPLFTLDQFRIFTLAGFSSVQSRRMREVGTPVNLSLRAKCQDSNRPTGVDGSTGFGTPTLRGIWDTFPLLMSGSAGMQVVGTEPTFTPGCTPGSSGCCTELHSPINAGGTAVPEEHLAVGTKDAIRALLTPPLAVPATGHGAALGLSASDLDALIAYLRSL